MWIWINVQVHGPTLQQPLIHCIVCPKRCTYAEFSMESMKLQSLLNPELRTPAAASISSRQSRSTTVQVMTVVRSGSKLRPQQTELNIPSLPRPLSVCVSGSERKSENGCMDRCMDTYISVLLFPFCGHVLLLSCFVWDTYEISLALTILDFAILSLSPTTSPFF